jgi:hypothetical protein
LCVCHEIELLRTVHFVHGSFGRGEIHFDCQPEIASQEYVVTDLQQLLYGGRLYRFFLPECLLVDLVEAGLLAMRWQDRIDDADRLALRDDFRDLHRGKGTGTKAPRFLSHETDEFSTFCTCCMRDALTNVNVICWNMLALTACSYLPGWSLIRSVKRVLSPSVFGVSGEPGGVQLVIIMMM